MYCFHYFLNIAFLLPFLISVDIFQILFTTAFQKQTVSCTGRLDIWQTTPWYGNLSTQRNFCYYDSRICHQHFNCNHYNKSMLLGCTFQNIDNIKFNVVSSNEYSKETTTAITLKYMNKI